MEYCFNAKALYDIARAKGLSQVTQDLGLPDEISTERF